MSSSAKLITIKHRGQTKRIALVNGLPAAELNKNLQASFNLITTIVGLEDTERGVIYPLSLLSKDVSLFNWTATYSLLLSFDPSFAHEEGDDEAEESELEESKAVDSSYASSRDRDRSNLYSAAMNGNGSYAGPDDDEFDDDDDGDYDESAGGGGAAGASADQSYDSKFQDDDEDSDDDRDSQLLAYIQSNTAFSALPMHEILQVFRNAATANGGVIDRSTFERCFTAVVNKRAALHPNVEKDKKIIKIIANRVFDVFDRDLNGVVDSSEFLAGLSLLCHATSEDKIKAAFSLFDADGDGFISYQEMLRYMTSFFEVCFALDSNMKKRFGDTSAQQVAIATANHCFVRADTNKDGHISFDEFRNWCNSEDSLAMATVPV